MVMPLTKGVKTIGGPVRSRKWTGALPLLLFCAGAFLLYFPNLGRTFASDDFLVMKRVGMDKVIWIKGFFRPLTDMIHYVNYLIGGFDPIGYYALHILMHGINSWLFFRFCMLWKWTADEKAQRKFALLASLFFLAYPFHSEGVSWILGISALSAGMFGMAALLVLVSGFSQTSRIFWFCFFYFIAMAGYESVLLLPLMMLVIVYGETRSIRVLGRWAVVSGVTLGAHLVVRVLVSGVLAGEYGGKFFGGRLLYYGKNVFALWDRLFLPPVQDFRMMVASCVLLGLLLTTVGFSFWRRVRGLPALRNYFIQLLLLLAIACTVPVLSGLSTHTSESDRFLYFPSYFLCAGIAFVLMQLFRDRAWLHGMVGLILVYEVFFVEANNRNWIEASQTTRGVLAEISGAKLRAAGKKVFVVNLPDEYDGAYIFRLGLPDALLMEGIDTSGLVILSHLSRDEELKLADSLAVRESRGILYLPPDVVVAREGRDSFRIVVSGRVTGAAGGSGAVKVWYGGRGDVVLFWNRKRVVRWDQGEW
jgi:hypothetical protein